MKVKSTEHKTQHQNKLNAIEALKLALVKQRFENIDEDDLTEGRDFLKGLD
ncbi:MAG: hypothetical protein MK088_05290 [Alteromonas sp.]|nr:hypothetical protein [Alteromonas sp.]